MNGKTRFFSLILIDAILVSLAVVFAYLLRFDFNIQAQFRPQIPYVITVFTGILLILNYYFGIYKRMWRYASIGELITIIKVAGLSSVLFFMLYIGVKMIHPLVIPRSIFLITMGLNIFLLGGSRLLWRMSRDGYTKLQPHHERAVIVGAGDAGTLLARDLKHNEQVSIYPIGFVDDDPTKCDLEVLGIPILGTREDIPQIVEKHSVDMIIIAIPSAKRKDIREIFDIAKKSKVRVKIVPKVSDFIEGRISIQQIRDVNVEDLLGREPVQV